MDKLFLVLKSFREDLHPRNPRGSEGGGRFKKKDSPSDSWIDNIDVTQLPPPDVLEEAIRNNDETAGDDFIMSGDGFYTIDFDEDLNEEDFESEDELYEARYEQVERGKEKLREKLGAEIKRLLDKSDGVGVRRPITALESLIKNGRIGNVHTLPTYEELEGLEKDERDRIEDMQTFNTQDYRTELENAFFGRAAGIEDDGTDRPVYGFVRSNVVDKNDMMKQYGEVELIVKPEVLEKRAFVTVGDSGAHNMDENVEFKPKLVPSPYANPQGYSVPMDGVINPFKRGGRYGEEAPTNNLFDTADVGDLDTYIEVQIVGGLRLQDIERIEIHNSDRAVDYMSMVDDDVIKELERRGIKIEMMY